MSNLPSLPDLETDELSIGLTENSNDLFHAQGVVGISKEKPGQFLPPNHFRKEIQQLLGYKQPCNAETETSINTGPLDLVDADLEEFVSDKRDGKNETEMTVVKDKECDKGDGQGLKSESSPRTGSPNGMEVEDTRTKDAFIPLLDEFTDLTIGEFDDELGEEEPTDSLDDWSRLEEVDEDGDTLLHMAIINANPYLASMLIQIMAEYGLDFNPQNLLFQTPLHLAVLTEQADLVRLLVENGADLTMRDCKGRTPAHIATEMRHPKLINCLLSSSEDSGPFKMENGKTKPENVLNVKNYDGESCVHIAAKSGDIDLMRCLTQNGANLNLADEKSGRTALHFAAEKNDVKMVAFLLGIRGVIPSPETLSGETPILLAYLRDFDEIVELIRRNQEKNIQKCSRK